MRDALEAVLASPFFVLRLEREPDNVDPGETYRLEGPELASRLSFFLWGTPPDAELLRVAESGDLNDPRQLEQQARRMLADPRAEALGNRFAFQWLRLQDIYKVRPDPNFFPNFDETLADAMTTETSLFFNHLVQQDLDALELFEADYTFVNERLATHYGMQGVAGDHFRRVPYTDERSRRAAGPRQRAGPHVAGKPDVTRPARQMGDGSAHGDATTATATGHPGSGRHRGHQWKGSV